MKTAKTNAQQGDCLFVKETKLPDGEQKVIAQSKIIVAHGEGGHSHVIDQIGSKMVKIDDLIYIILEQQATVVHEEHKPITLSPGVWEVGRVQEYDWFSKMTRQVVD